MSREADPFERAVSRAEKMRQRAASFESRSGIMRLAMYWLGVLGAGWAILLAVHWLVFPDPLWLVVSHTIIFALVVGYYLVGLAFIGSMKRRRPDLFDAPLRCVRIRRTGALGHGR